MPSPERPVTPETIDLLTCDGWALRDYTFHAKPETTSYCRPSETAELLRRLRDRIVAAALASVPRPAPGAAITDGVLAAPTQFLSAMQATVQREWNAAVVDSFREDCRVGWSLNIEREFTHAWPLYVRFGERMFALGQQSGADLLAAKREAWDEASAWLRSLGFLTERMDAERDRRYPSPERSAVVLANGERVEYDGKVRYRNLTWDSLAAFLQRDNERGYVLTDAEITTLYALAASLAREGR